MFLRTERSIYACTRRLSRIQQRYLSDAASSNPPQPPRAGAAKLDNRSLIAIRGAETPKFLQGLITNNVDPKSTSGFFAAFLTPAGRLINDVFIYPTRGSQWAAQSTTSNGSQDESGYLIEADAAQADGLIRLLKRHRLRSKFEIRLLDKGELDVWNVWKEDESWTNFGQSGEFGNATGLLGVADKRAPGMGDRLLLSESQLSQALGDAEKVPQVTYTVRRYLRGVAEGLSEIPEGSLPMNANLDVMGGIDFKKGCYAGQELTIRTHHTGVVRRRILPVSLYALDQAAPATMDYDASLSYTIDKHAEIKREETSKRGAGKLSGLVGNIGLAVCPVEHMPEGKLDSGAWTIASQPIDQFVVRGSDQTNLYGVQAFVPDWLRARIREPKIQRRVE